MRTFFANLHKLPLLLTLISPCLISYTNSDTITKNKSLTKGFEEIVQAFRSYGDIRTSHDSKNRCVTWLLLELWDSISQSINMRMHTHTLYAQMWWSHFLPVWSNLNHVFTSHEECLLSCDTVVLEVVGRGSSDSCFPSALSQLQSASRNPAQGIRGAEQQSGAQRSAGAKIPPIRRSSQFVLPYPRCSSGVSGLLVQCYVQIRSQRWTSCRHLGVIMPFPHCFLSFHPNPARLSSAVLLSLCWLSSLGLFRF